MLDRVDLRLDQQVDDEARHVRHVEPHDAEHRLEHDGELALRPAEAEPLVDGVKRAVDAFEQSVERVHHEAEQAGEDVPRHARHGDAQRVQQRLFERAPRGGVEQHRGREVNDGEHRGPAGGGCLGGQQRQHDRGDRQRFDRVAEHEPHGLALEQPPHQRQAAEPAGDVHEDRPQPAPDGPPAARRRGAERGPVH
jgi:hypothetical protein